MSIIQRVADRNGAGLKALAALQRRLSLEEGAVSEASRRKTREAFGEDLSPIDVVRRIIADVRKEGDDAVVRYTGLLDGVDLAGRSLAVTPDEIDAGYGACDARLRAAIESAAGRVRRYQEHVRPAAPPDFTDGPVRVQTILRPLRRAGAYAPGGAARYPSSVIMTVVPAVVAGVRDVAVATPPGPEGCLPPAVRAACRASGATEVYRVGGVQGIAAMALGTQSIPRVDKIVGPGNTFVNLAKKELFGTVGIDLLAGPSEVLIIADGDADAARVAADLRSQAEHSPGAAVLVTDSESLASDVTDALAETCGQIDDGGRLAYSLATYGLLITTDGLDRCVEIANRFAAEHLQILTKNPRSVLPRITSAGAVFLGDNTPVAVGDYAAGPSHVLPTGGTTRFFSGLSVNDFLIRAAAVELAEDGGDVADTIEQIAGAEGLHAHAESIRIRRQQP